MTNSKNINTITWDEAYADTWIIVTDNNNCDIQVTTGDLIEENPNDPDNYVKVCYYGQHWWIPKSMHFPL